MDPDRRAQRRAPRAHAPIPMNDPSMRAMHINQLKERIERSAYTVDADAVAEALLRRPAAPRSLLPAPPARQPTRRPSPPTERLCPAAPNAPPAPPPPTPPTHVTPAMRAAAS